MSETQKTRRAFVRTGMSALGAFLCGRPSFPPFRKAQVSLVEDGKPMWFINPDTLERDRLLLA